MTTTTYQIPNFFETDSISSGEVGVTGNGITQFASTYTSFTAGGDAGNGLGTTWVSDYPFREDSNKPSPPKNNTEGTPSTPTSYMPVKDSFTVPNNTQFTVVPKCLYKEAGWSAVCSLDENSKCPERYDANKCILDKPVSGKLTKLW